MNYLQYKQARLMFPTYPANAAIGRVKLANEQFITSKDGFDLKLTVDPDDHVDLSWIGQFTDHPGNNEALETKAGRNSYKYFVPEYKLADRIKDNSRQGMSRHNAWLQAKADQYRDMKFATDYSPNCIKVTALKNGIELGSSSWLGGVEDECINNCANDLIDEAIEEAQDNLESLLLNA